MAGSFVPAPNAFDVGEEVVVRLEGTRVFQVEGDALQLWAMPLWTIAEVRAAWASAGGMRYEVRFRHRDGIYRCELSESAIEGSA